MKFPIKIKNQQEFDSLIIDRLNRNEQKLTKQHNEFLKTKQEEMDLLQIQVNEQQTKVNQFKEAIELNNQKQMEIDKLKLSYKYNLPSAALERLRGETYEELEKDAQHLSKKMEEIREANKPKPYVPPKPNQDYYYNTFGDGVCAEFEKLNPGIIQALEKIR